MQEYVFDTRGGKKKTRKENSTFPPYIHSHHPISTPTNAHICVSVSASRLGSVKMVTVHLQISSMIEIEVEMDSDVLAAEAMSNVVCGISVALYP